jgi:hypothetical protein
VLRASVVQATVVKTRRGHSTQCQFEGELPLRDSSRGFSQRFLAVAQADRPRSQML